MRLQLEQQIQNRKLNGGDLNYYIINAYKLSKSKEAALDDLKEGGIALTNYDENDPIAADLKHKFSNKSGKISGITKQHSLKVKPKIDVNTKKPEH